MPEVIHRVCPICGTDGRDAPALPYGPPEWPLKQCRACGLVYLERAAAYTEMIENLSWEKTSRTEAGRRATAEPHKQTVSDASKTFRRRILKRDKVSALIAEHFQAGKVVDVGCGNKVLHGMPAHFVPIGIEISRELAAKSGKKAARRGGRVICADALSGLRSLQDEDLSGVVMSAYLEHELQPRLVLSETLRALKPGGRVIIKVPNFASWNRVLRGRRWCGFRFPDHVNYFTPGSLRALAQSVGFAIARCRFLDRLPTSDTLLMVLSKPG